MEGKESSRVLASLIFTLEQFFGSTTFNGFKLILVIKGKLLKCTWGLLLLGVFTFSGILMYSAWLEFTKYPTITTIETEQYPVRNIYFPAIAVCSVNKLSKKAVNEYLSLLKEKMANDTKAENLNRWIPLLGAIIDGHDVDPDEAVEFQTILDYLDSDDSTFNVRATLESLAPSCDDIFKKCQWMGETLGCKDIFRLTATPDGYCCIFNYIATDNISFEQEPLRANAKGANNGLVLLLNASTDDYTYTMRSVVGFVVKIFDSYNFPDLTTGGVRELVIGPLEEFNVIISASKLTSEESIRQHSTKERKCYFLDERFAEYGKFYSGSECFTKCKLRSIMALCKCIPYYAPVHLLEEDSNTAFCTLSHLGCLKRYEVTWNTYKPSHELIESLEKEMEDALECPMCLPLCSYTKYNFELSSSKLQPFQSKNINWDILKEFHDVKDMSILRVYFGSPKTILYKTDVVYTWYEILGYFGGLFGICLGCSIISIIEIIYFLTFKLFENIQQKKTNLII